MLTLTSPTPAPPREVGQLLARLRRRVWTYVWIEGAVALLVMLGLAFWLSLGFDWVFEPPPVFRQGVLVLVGLLALWLVYRLILRRTLVRLGDRSLALVVERRFGQFHDGLLTSVELADPGHAQPFNSEMLEHTRRQAAAGAERLDLTSVFNLRPLFRRGALAIVLVASILVFWLLAGDAFALWARRSLQFSNEIWPRRTHLSVVGFERSDHRKVARGADFELLARAEAAPERLVPEVVDVRYEAADGATGRENLRRQGVATPGIDEFQQYATTLKGVLASRKFYVYGGDDRVGPLYLDVVDSPALARTVLACRYPTYQHRANAELPVSAAMQVPRGVEAVLRAQANKDLVEVQIDQTVADGQPTTRKLTLGAGGGRRNFELPLGPIVADTTLLFTLRDTDGLVNREPIRLALTAVSDEPPKVDVQLKGIGSAITPQARLPMVGAIGDDYGVAEAWFAVEIDGQTPTKHAFHPAASAAQGGPAPPQKLDVDRPFEVEPLKLAPKQKLQLAVEALDNYRLPETNEPANTGRSQRYLLDVVTPDQLRAILENRELTLRRRFEIIIEETTATRDSLAALPLERKLPSATPSEKPADKPAEKPAKPDRAAEPGDRPTSRPAARPAAAAAGELPVDAREVQLERVLQNGERAAHETLQVALAFDDIYAELVNNRVDTEELKRRILEGISDPLKKISGESFAELGKRVRKVRQQLADPAASTTARTAAVEQADKVLVELKAVLDKMLELETFNEVLDLLRSILADQEKLNQRTKERQKEKVKDLIK